MPRGVTKNRGDHVSAAKKKTMEHTEFFIVIHSALATSWQKKLATEILC